MIRASEEAEDRYRRIAERRRIPPVPDLRFEYSYLRSVRQYVQLERPAPPQTSEKGKEKAVGVAAKESSSARQPAAEQAFCHQCRNKNSRAKMRCTFIRASGERCGLRYCDRCIELRCVLIPYSLFELCTHRSSVPCCSWHKQPILTSALA